MLLSLDNTFLGFIHVIVCIYSSFIFNSVLYSIARLYHVSFILCTIRGLLGCFLFGVITKIPQRTILYVSPGEHVLEFLLAIFLGGTSGS